MYQEYIDDSDYDNKFDRRDRQIRTEMEDKADKALDKLSKAVHPEFVHIFADLIVENYHGRIANNIAKSLDIEEDEIFSLDRDIYNYKRWLDDRIISNMSDYDTSDYEAAYL